MKIPDFHVSNVSVDETCFIDNLDLLEIIISSLVSQYIDQDITINETLKNKFTAPTIDTSKSPDEQKLQIKNNLPDHQKDLPETTKETIAAVLQAAPPATVEFKEITDSSGNVVEESIEVSAKNDSSGNDTVVSTFSEEDTDTATKVTFEIKQSDDTDVDEDVNDIVIAAGLYLPRSPSSGGNRTIVQRSVESTVRKVVSRMTKHNEGVYPAIANVMESSYDIGGTNLGKMLNTFYMFFVDVTKGTDGLKWSFVYPVEKNSVVTYKSYPLDEVPSNITANVGVTINADYLRKPGIFDITFGDDDSGTSYKTSVDLNPSPQSDDTSGGDTSSSTQPTPIPFDKPGTPFIVINGGDKVNIKDIEKVFDPPDPTPTPSPTVTITHPTPTPSVSVTPSTTIYPTPTPTMTISPSPTITDTQDISTLFKFTKNGTNVDVSINANQMNIVGTSEDIAGFTLAFYVPSDYDATNKVSLVGSFENFQYRYATSNTTQNVLYVTGYSLFSGTSNPVPINRSGDGYMSVLRIAGIRQDYVVSPVNPAHNNVVAVSNREAKLWNLNMAYNASISNGFYVSDMTESHIMLNVDGNMFPEQGVDYFEIELEGIDITGVEDVESNFAGWTLELYGSNKIKVTRGAGVSNMARWSMKRLKLAYRDITGDIKIKDGVADDKKIKSGYLIPEDIRFDNGTAYIQTKNLKDPIKSFLVTAKGDLGSVAVSTFLNAKEWTVEGRYNRRDGYTRIMGYSTKGESYKFTGGEALFTYTNTVRAYRVDPQFPGHAFINALNTNIATMGNVLTGDDLANTSMSRFSWLLDHIAGKPDLPNEETLGEFYLKSDVTFDGRILVNDVVALKQYILGNLEYPSVRPLGVFEVKYTINSIPQEVFQKLSENLPALAARIEEMIYGSSTGKNVIIIGSELETNGEAHIYARVFWRDATLYGDAIMSATKMFDDVSYSLPYNNASQTINLSAADPTGVLAVKHNDGNSFTVYGNGLSNIKYSTYHDSTIRDYSGTITESKYFNDITISGLQSGFDVLYVTGGGRTVAVVVTDTDTGTVDPTPTMSTTISPTPTVTQTITPTPTMTITPTPTMTVTITDSPDKEDEPSGYDYYARLVHVTDTVYLWGPDYPGTSRSYHVLQIKPKQSTPFVAIDVRFTKDVKVKPGDFEITDALSDDFGDFQKNGTSEYNPSTFFFACGYGQVTNLPPDVYTTVLIVKTKDASDELGFSALEASKGTGTGEIALGVRVGDGDVYYSVYTPNVSTTSRMMVSKLLHSVGTGMDWNNSGDTDQSGSINVLDVVNILRYYADDTTFTQSKRQMVEKYGDVTQDGRVNTLDAVRILSFYAGLDGFDLPQRPVSTVPDSSGSPTFVLSNLATPSAGWTSFKVSIDTTTLNPYEFYVGNDANNPHRASVDRNGDDETKYVKSNSDSRRYQRIRSIELVFSGHVYLGDNTTNDVISKYTSAQQGDRDLGPDHDYMYVYCARTTVGEAKETRVMIVNAHNLITSTSGSLKIPNILFIEGTQTLDDIRGLIDWSKSYIGTTSIYKAKWNPMLQDGTTSAYELTKYTTSTGNTLRDFYWKKKDTAVGASSEHGLFMRYSIDDGNAIFPGGVSKESFTSTPGQGGRLMIDEYYLGNIDGNIEEY